MLEEHFAYLKVSFTKGLTLFTLYGRLSYMFRKVGMEHLGVSGCLIKNRYSITPVDNPHKDPVQTY